MKLSKSDIPLLRRSILALCASAIVSAVALYGSGQYAEKTEKARRDAQNRLNDAHNRLTSAHDDQQNMSAYSGEYGALEKRKIIGDEQRLDWMESLENIRQQNLVTDFRYNIAPQRIYAPQLPIDSGNFDVRYSEMKLQFDLLHEAQLLDFFTALRSQTNGWYQLQGCSLQRTGSDENTETARLTAECSGGWITLKNRNTPP
jgi:hypothetical protein